MEATMLRLKKTWYVKHGAEWVYAGSMQNAITLIKAIGGLK